MSWTQRPGSAAPERPPHQPQPTQSFGNLGQQQKMYPNYQEGPPPAANTQQQYWQTPRQPQFNQQYGQVYQQDYGNNANQFYQQPTQYNQNYTNQGYASQPGYQQGYYQNLQQQQSYQSKPNTDGWEDNWDWGWEESAKQAQNAAGQNSVQNPVLAAPPPQHQVFNNANVIEESFVSTDTWNWSMEDKVGRKEPVPPVLKQEPARLPVESSPIENKVVETPQRSTSNHSAHQPVEEVRSLSDRDAIKEKLPNLALGKRFHLDNLTPQWSIESQMSQESSDGPQTHSEGTYRSDNQSRNSSKSSPGLNTDNSNFNYSQSGLDEYPPSSEWSTHSKKESTLVDNVQNDSRRESHHELSNSIQAMSIRNMENPTPNTSQDSKELEARKLQEIVPPVVPSPSTSPTNFPPLGPSIPPPLSSANLPPGPTASSASLPPSSSSVILPPPTSFPSSSTNPFKQSGPFSHKKVASASPSLQSFPPSISNINLTSPAAVNMLQHRAPVGFGANLETTPDNSERPDQPQITTFRPMPAAQQVPDNLEVAPQNDRNEYLQTAHLSSGDYGENTDFSRGVPPLGLRRLVVGQQESEYGQNLNLSGDEPPPGFARMVPGQQTEADNSYNQSSENYMDRHIDGQPTDISGRPYRQADGQQTQDYAQPPNRAGERRPIGLDRMVPGESSNIEYPQYQGSNYASANDQRVVMGVDHDYQIPIDAGPSDIREQNVDGSDYSEQTPRNPQRNIIGAREADNDVTANFNPAPEEQQREVLMEGENLQDLSIVSSIDLTFSREQTLDGADVTATDVVTDRKTDGSDSIDHAVSSSRRQSLNRVNTSGDESERDRLFKSSPRRDRDKHKSSRERDRDKDGRYSRGERKYDRESDRRSGRDDRRSEKDRRGTDRDRDPRGRDESPDARRHRRCTRSHRYETEDTDYYSDKEREHRRYREGSYTSKPPRPDDKDRRYDERDRNRRYNTIERDRRYDDERDGASRSRRGERHRDRYERRYRDIDPNRKYGNLRREREDEDHRRGETFSSPSRPASRDAPGTDDDVNEAPGAGAGAGEARRRAHADAPRRARLPRDARDGYYDGYGTGAYSDAYALQRQQYQYYEHLRLADPAAYLQVYKQVMAGRAPHPPSDPRLHHNTHLYGEGFATLGYEARAEDRERGSVHSGRSSTNGLKGNDTYFARYRLESGAGTGSAGGGGGAPSLRADDVSDRELNTDASLNLHLEDSTVRSERMTPFKFSTAHIKGSISSRHVVVVRASYPVDGLPATVHILSLSAALAAAGDPLAADMALYPGPLVKGVTHKKSVIDYCMGRVGGAARAAGRDVIGYVLLWDLLATLLRQNGVVVGVDIAELLMKNTREYEYRPPAAKPAGAGAGTGAAHNESRRGSSLSGREEEARAWSPDQPSASASDLTAGQDEMSSPGQTAGSLSERAALDRLREYLIYGNRQEALEWAMSNNLWGHALQLAVFAERRTRALVAARFLAAAPRADPIHTLYAHLQAKQPPAATCVADERWGDWRPHAAIILANTSAKPDQDRRTLTQLGDSLSSRGLLYSAQFCYVSAGVPFSRHPLAPLQPPAPAPLACPRLALLMADPRATTLSHLASNHAIFATEIYEYAMSLNQDYVINELQVYKLILASRLVDAGQYERALAYTEQAARAVTRSPRDFAPHLVAQLAELADRLKYHDPALHEEAGAGEAGAGAGSDEPSPSPTPTPRHQQWLDDVKTVAHQLALQAEAASQQATPQHEYYAPPAPAPADPAPPAPGAPYAPWSEQVQPQYPPPPQQQQYSELEEAPDYSHYYQQQPTEPPPHQLEPQQQVGYSEEPQHQGYADPYWTGDAHYGYGEQPGPPAAGGGAAGGGAGTPGGDEQRPMITMPGTAPSRHALYDDDRPPSADQAGHDADTAAPAPAGTQHKAREEAKGDAKGKSGWLGGILTKLSLRAPNQMILPDDKNPAIVWDSEHKRWRNTDADAEEEESARAPPPPPPRLPDLAHHHQNAPPGVAPSVSPGMAPPAAPVSNIFKMQKGRHIKKSYVDVFNPSGAPTRPLPPASEVLGPAPLQSDAFQAPSYFVPAAAAQEYQPGEELERYHSGI